MPREITNTPIHTIYDYEAMTTSATDSGKKLGYLNIELGEVAEKLKYDSQLAHEYLSEGVSGYDNLYKKIEDRLKKFISIYPHPADKLVENYSQIISALQASGTITPAEARGHLTALLPEVIALSNKPGAVAWATSLVDTIKNDAEGREELIKKLTEKMADPSNEIIDQQGNKNAFQRLSFMGRNSSMYVRAVVKIFEDGGIRISHKSDKTPIDKKIFDAARKTSEEIVSDLTENTFKIIRSRIWTDNRNAMLDVAREHIHSLSRMQAEIDKHKPGLLDALAGSLDTMYHEGLTQHEQHAAGCRERDEAIVAEKAAEREAKYAERDSQENFNIMEFAEGVMSLSRIIMTATSGVKPCDIESLTEKGKIKQDIDRSKVRVKQEKAQQKEKSRQQKGHEENITKQIAAMRNDIHGLENALRQINTTLKIPNLTPGQRDNLEGLRDLVARKICDSEFLAQAILNLEALKKANKESLELINELPHLRKRMEKQREIDEAISHLYLDSESGSASDTDSVHSQPTAKQLRDAHVRPMVVDNGKGGEETIYVELTNDTSMKQYIYDGETGMFRQGYNHVDAKGKRMRLPGGFNLPPAQRAKLQEFMKENISGFSTLTEAQLDNYINNIPADSADNYTKMLAFLFKAKKGKEAEWITKHQPVKDDTGPEVESQVQPKGRRDKPEAEPEAGPSQPKRVKLRADGGAHGTPPRSRPSASGALHAPFGSPRVGASSSSRRSEPVASHNTERATPQYMATTEKGEVLTRIEIPREEWPETLIHYTDGKGFEGIGQTNRINSSCNAKGVKNEKKSFGGYFTNLSPLDASRYQISKKIIGMGVSFSLEDKTFNLLEIKPQNLPEGSKMYKCSWSDNIFTVESPDPDKSIRLVQSKVRPTGDDVLVWKGTYNGYKMSRNK